MPCFKSRALFFLQKQFLGIKLIFTAELGFFALLYKNNSMDFQATENTFPKAQQAEQNQKVSV
jgi:hypothetical protein